MPGLAEPDLEVRKAFGTDILYGYGKDWSDVYYSTVNLFSDLLGCKGYSVILPGNSHMALDMAINCIAPNKTKILSIANGFWGLKLAEIMKLNGHEVKTTEFLNSRILDIQEIENIVQEYSPQVITLVHGESSEGVLNPLEEVARIAELNGSSLLIDAVATAGVVPINLEQCGKAVVVANSSKGIGAFIGHSMVSLNSQALKDCLLDTSSKGGYFTNIKEWYGHQNKECNTIPSIGSFSIPHLHALNRALGLIHEQGEVKRLTHHESVSRKLRSLLFDLGLVVIESANALPTVTTARIQEGCANTIVNKLAKRNIFIDVGFERVSSMLRIGHMGTSADMQKLEVLVNTLKMILRR